MGVQSEGSVPTGSRDAPGGLGRRLVARLVDAIVLAAVGSVAGVAFDFNVLWLVLQSLLVFAYFVLADVVAGTTLGKRMLGLRVTGPDGGRPDLRQAAVREAFTLVGAVPYVGPVLALAAWIVIGVTINASATGQGKHDDLAGGTRVVGTMGAVSA
jgi:uncharacterized RDD family membrane protein YckC